MLLVVKHVPVTLRVSYYIVFFLQVGENTIRVEFTSAVNYGTKRQEELGYRVPPECPPPAFHGECNGNKVRKMQCSFSWDWGPAFVSQGIWYVPKGQTTSEQSLIEIISQTD